MELWSCPEYRETVIQGNVNESMEFRIRKWELEEALVRTENGKAPGLNGINIELIEYASAAFKNR